jgi:methionyl-tRNA formyltransferase
MRVIFLGTPEFAVASLEALVESGIQVAGVVTQPDRPAGRGGTIQPPAVKVAAHRLGLNLFQPETLRSTAVVAQLRELAPDALVVVAYGQILRRSVLELPALGCLNLHASLLPWGRGASPIQAAIREGLTETGVTVMLMNERMDAGPMLAQRREPVLPTDTTPALSARLAPLGAALLVETLPRWQAGQVVPQPQDPAIATYCRPIRKEDSAIDWSEPAVAIERTCRAYTPWPGCTTTWRDRALRLGSIVAMPDWDGQAAPGTIVLLPGSTSSHPILGIATGQGAVAVNELQLAGRRQLSAAEFLRGQPSLLDSVLGEVKRSRLPLAVPAEPGEAAPQR